MQAYRSLVKKSCVLVLVGLAGGAWAAGSDNPVAVTGTNNVAAATGTNNLAAAKFFAEKVRPLLQDNCYDCHSLDNKVSGGLRVDDHAGILKGGDTGPGVVPGEPDASLVLQRVLLPESKKRMPKNSDPLTADQIDILRTWIKNGATWSDEAPEPSAGIKLATLDTSNPAAGQLDFFEKKIRPIFASHCYNCHSADTKPAGGLRVDDYDGLLSGGDLGPGIVPGHPEQSLVLTRILSKNPQRRMPKEGDLLTESEVSDLAAWVKNGAPWPREEIPKSLGKIRADYTLLRTNHWAWQQLTNPAVPMIAHDTWSRSDLDRFVLAKLKEKDLAPVGDADRQTLIRRVSFDLTGLPPTPAEVDAFVKDRSTNAFASLVDRLLASPRYGERWGRHWLDVARYAESTGPSRNVPYPHAWKFRDYVIDAVNQDIPYGRFVQEQVAGDLLPAATPAERDRLNTATGFLAIGVKDVNQRFKNRFVMDNVDEQIDVVTRSVLAATVSCARCHDHKFDPFPTKDYYALAGIFVSTENCAGLRNKMGGGGLDYYDPTNLVKLANYVATKVPQDQVDKLTAEVVAAKEKWDAIRGTPEGLTITNGVPYQRRFRLKYEKLEGELLALTDPVSQGHAVHGVREAKVITDTDVRIRGEAERRGPTVPRGFLTTFTVPGAPAIPTNESGRLQLAQWLTSPKNPLVARVYVNRVWEHLFGKGIVSTVDNFGVMGDRPSNQELLDYLANSFIENGWSTKQLIREIVLSHAYQLSSDAPAAYVTIDPEDHYVWRHAPRRLEAEEIRDAILATAGDLDLNRPATSVVSQLPMVEIRDNGIETKHINEAADRSHYRSIYLPLLRGVTPASLAAFDPVDQTLVTGQRQLTTVPTQALFMLNSKFVARQAYTLATNLLAQTKRSDSERIQEAYRLTLGRPATRSEVSRDKKFISHYEADYRDNVPSSPEVEPAAKVMPVSLAVADATTDGKPKIVVPVNPDDIDTTDVPVVEEGVQPRNETEAAWLSFTRSLYASAEFQFVQ